MLEPSYTQLLKLRWHIKQIQKSNSRPDIIDLKLSLKLNVTIETHYFLLKVTYV